MDRKLSFCRPFVAAIVVCMVGLGVEVALGEGHSRGDAVVFEGFVTDSSGEPLEGLWVVFEASKSGRSVTRPRRHESGVARRSTRSGSDGGYRFEWDWHSFYNRFRIKVLAAAVDPATEPELQTLVEIEIDKEVWQQNPVKSDLVVGDAEFVRLHREFATAARSADQTRIYEEMGKPDRVVRMLRDDIEWVSWWYFERGQAYRFRFGKLAEVRDFDPITPF